MKGFYFLAMAFGVYYQMVAMNASVVSNLPAHAAFFNEPFLNNRVFSSMAFPKSKSLFCVLVAYSFLTAGNHSQSMIWAAPAPFQSSDQKQANSDESRPGNGGSRTSVQTVTVTTLGQQSVQGILRSLSSKEIEVELTAEVSDQAVGEHKTIQAEEIERIHFGETVFDVPSPLPNVVTSDHSVISARQFSGEGNAWNLESNDWKLAAPLTTNQVRVLQLKNLVDSQQAEWSELLSEPDQADSVIAVRPTGDLTRVQGTIVAIKESKVHFEFDDQKLEMPIERLAGLTWFVSKPERFGAGVQVVTKDGSLWNTQSMDLKDDTLTLETSSKIRASIPVTSLVEIRMGSANLSWVKDAEKLDAQSDFESAQKKNNPLWKFSESAASKVFTPRFVVVGGNTSSTTNASNFDLQFTQPGYYEFRMPQGFKTLECAIVRTDEGQVRSDLVLEVWQDTDRVWRQNLDGDQESTQVRLELAEGKRVKLQVIDTSNSSIGTEVYWKQPRLLK